MMQDKIGLKKLSDGEDGEQFWIVYISAEKLARHNGYFRSKSRSMTEDEVREFFVKGGQPASDVEAMFQTSRNAYHVKHGALSPRIHRQGRIRSLPLRVLRRSIP
jgi:hypothetical protein